jgi:hypothetical protein
MNTNRSKLRAALWLSITVVFVVIMGLFIEQVINWSDKKAETKTKT